MSNSKKSAIDYLEKSTLALMRMLRGINKRNLTEFDKRAIESINKQINILKRLENE